MGCTEFRFARVQLPAPSRIYLGAHLRRIQMGLTKSGEEFVPQRITNVIRVDLTIGTPLTCEGRALHVSGHGRTRRP